VRPFKSTSITQAPTGACFYCDGLIFNRPARAYQSVSGGVTGRQVAGGQSRHQHGVASATASFEAHQRGTVSGLSAQLSKCSRSANQAPRFEASYGARMKALALIARIKPASPSSKA
jgi:hypothetical protein